MPFETRGFATFCACSLIKSLARTSARIPLCRNSVGAEPSLATKAAARKLFSCYDFIARNYKRRARSVVPPRPSDRVSLPLVISLGCCAAEWLLNQPGELYYRLSQNIVPAEWKKARGKIVIFQRFLTITSKTVRLQIGHTFVFETLARAVYKPYSVANHSGIEDCNFAFSSTIRVQRHRRRKFLRQTLRLIAFELSEFMTLFFVSLGRTSGVAQPPTRI